MVARPLDEVLAVVVVHPEHLVPVDLDDVVLRPQAGVVGDGAVVDLEKRKESVVPINMSEKFRYAPSKTFNEAVKSVDKELKNESLRNLVLLLGASTLS